MTSNTLKADVSVVIPCYQCANTITRCVESVLAQSLMPKEIILVDDKSNDATLVKLKQIQTNYNASISILIHQQPVNRGAASARNAGWEIANTQYIAFLDADDTWHPQKIETQYTWMVANQNVTLSCHAISRDNQLDLSHHIFLPIKPIALLFKNKVLTSSVMLQRKIPLKFDPQQRLSEDYWLWLNLIFNRYQIFHSESTLTSAYKPAYGSAGLSEKLWPMQKAEIDNFYRLLKMKYIGFALFLLAVSFSMVKFSRRVVLNIFSISQVNE